MANTKIDSIKLSGSDTVYDINLPTTATPSITSLTTSSLTVTGSANLTNVEFGHSYIKEKQSTATLANGLTISYEDTSTSSGYYSYLELNEFLVNLSAAAKGNPQKYARLTMSDSFGLYDGYDTYITSSASGTLSLQAKSGINLSANDNISLLKTTTTSAGSGIGLILSDNNAYFVRDVGSTTNTTISKANEAILAIGGLADSDFNISSSSTIVFKYPDSAGNDFKGIISLYEAGQGGNSLRIAARDTTGDDNDYYYCLDVGDLGFTVDFQKNSEVGNSLYNIFKVNKDNTFIRNNLMLGEAECALITQKTKLTESTSGKTYSNIYDLKFGPTQQASAEDPLSLQTVVAAIPGESTDPGAPQSDYVSTLGFKDIYGHLYMLIQTTLAEGDSQRLDNEPATIKVSGGSTTVVFYKMAFIHGLIDPQNTSTSPSDCVLISYYGSKSASYLSHTKLSDLTEGTSKSTLQLSNTVAVKIL